VAPEQSTTLSPRSLGFRVLGRAPERVPPREAARALQDFLRRKRPGLARMLHIEATPRGVGVTARGEHPDRILEELRSLLQGGPTAPADAELEVDPDEFRVEVTARESPGDERIVLRSRVRSFPYPVCQWYDISTGLLTLTDARLIYEPEDLIMDDAGLAGGHVHVSELQEIRRAYRGSWWDVPCLMLDTTGPTRRYGWPARREEPELEFQVGEWLDALREMLPRDAGGPQP
jgi:hypothetical protein